MYIERETPLIKNIEEAIMIYSAICSVQNYKVNL